VSGVLHVQITIKVCYVYIFRNVFGEVGPTSAITGGVLAQEMVKAVSHKDQPLVNIFVCNPLEGTGYVENLVD